MSGQQQLAEVYGGPIDAPPSIFLCIEKGLKSNPHGAAVIVSHQQHDHLKDLVRDESDDATQIGASQISCLTWTYSQLHRAALRVSAGFIANGVTLGSTLMTFVPNGVEAYLLLYVSALMKLTLIPLDYGTLNEPRREELENQLRRIKPTVVVVLDAAGSAAVEDALTKSRSRRPMLCVQVADSAEKGKHWRTALDLLHNGRAHPIDEQKLMEEARDDDPERVCLIMFTSGTSSGKPKGCLRHVVSMTQFLVVRRWVDDLGPSSRLLLTTSFFRIIAPGVTMSIWYFGGTVVTASPLFDPAAALDAIERHTITTTVIIPAMLHALTAQPNFKQRNLSTVTGIATGGDIITRDTLYKISEAFPSAQVNVAHGMTEGGSLFHWPYSSTPINDIPFYGEIAPLGGIEPGARARIWDHDNDQVAMQGQAGELHVSSNAFLRQYLDGVNEDAFYEDENGRWFKTGDLGMITEEGLVYILGRIKDIIKRAGVGITPAALESSIAKFTGAQTSVIAVPSATLGQEPFAVLDDFNKHNEQDVKQCVLDLFGKDYALAGAATLKQLGLDAFPLNATSKVMKIDLLKPVEAYLSR